MAVRYNSVQRYSAFGYLSSIDTNEDAKLTRPDSRKASAGTCDETTRHHSDTGNEMVVGPGRCRSCR